MPLDSDQGIDAKFVADVWKVGIRTLFDEKQIVRKDTLKNCICEIMDMMRKAKRL
ncbi:putative indole-3-acetate beta-glucosyltransferase [Medicago truncatula]|uniref:Putative indole-3-acetate beta-glucosyltransferase n=1 Tax=Medicago truncatula TaxID=3880 RepID=A0A396H867_MEDTR|nr:putative indole-3-acetate beta-glucosyltransferase [Medicago truncatula]